MLVISHRGNTHGPQESSENHPEWIKALTRMWVHVEIDVWKIGELFYLGHDKPMYLVPETFFDDQYLWLHAKNTEAFSHLVMLDKRCFYHTDEDAVLVHNTKLIWTNLSEKLFSNSIMVLPEEQSQNFKEISGVCTDYYNEWITK